MKGYIAIGAALTALTATAFALPDADLGVADLRADDI